MKEVEIKVNGMMCSGCEKRIENALLSISEVDSAIANHENGVVCIKLNTDIDKNIFEEKIEDIGFEVVRGE